ncbi:hypothetical protein FPV67DRAFT_1469382 [Lyophyllum atratum]|nr:hypothetical protein FPV67DRAFT_1469382 [Lyophyllum atratum]
MPMDNQEQERPIPDVANPVDNESIFPSTASDSPHVRGDIYIHMYVVQAVFPSAERHNDGRDTPHFDAIVIPPRESAVDTAAMDIDEPLNLTTTSPDADVLLDADELLLKPTANESPLPADKPPSRKRGAEDAMIMNIDELTLLPVSSSALEDVEARVTSQQATDRPAKRRRLVLDAVELPNIVSIFGQRKIAVKQKTEESKEALKPLKNRKGTKKEDFTLSADTVWARLQPLGLTPFPIPVSKSILNFTASRQLFSKWYGGAMRSTFPDISKDNIEIHGLNDFMFPNPLYNPHVPEVPGVPGLWYTVRQDPSVRRSNPWNKPEQRVIVLVKPGVWQYQGQYEMTATESLTKEEWAAQNPKVRDTWAESIHVTLWGRATRARIALRAQLGRAPTLGELKTALKTKDHFKTVLPAQINRALLRGEETMAVWTMKCVGYDTEFQKGLMKKFKSHPECAAKSRAKGAPKKEKTAKAPKREREESNERGSGGLVDSDEVKPARRGAKYTPRGTRSRPN